MRTLIVVTSHGINHCVSDAKVHKSLGYEEVLGEMVLARREFNMFLTPQSFRARLSTTCAPFYYLFGRLTLKSPACTPFTDDDSCGDFCSWLLLIVDDLLVQRTRVLAEFKAERRVT